MERQHHFGHVTPQVHVILRFGTIAEGLPEQSDLAIDVVGIFDRLSAGGAQVEVEGVFAAGGDIFDEPAWVFGLVGSFEFLQVAGPGVPPDDSERIAVLEQDPVHQQARHPAIAVVERMDAHEPVVEDCRADDRVLALFLQRLVPVDQFAHRVPDLFRRREVIGLAGRGHDVVGRALVCADSDGPPGVSAVGGDCLDFVRLVQQHAVQIANERLAQRVVFPGHAREFLDCAVVAFDVEVFAHRLAACCEAVQQQAAGFRQREGVSFERVGVIVGLDPQLLFDPAGHLRRQRTQRVELLFEPVYGFEDVARHGRPLRMSNIPHSPARCRSCRSGGPYQKRDGAVHCRSP